MGSRIIIALFVEACAAPRLGAPSSLEVQASTMLVDWDDIPRDRCEPELHGMYLSYQGGAAILDGNDAADRACEHRVNLAQTGQKLAEARCKSCDADRQWAAWGKVGAGVVTALTVFVAIFAARELAR